MKFIDYDSFLLINKSKDERVYEKLKALALQYNIKIIINQKEQVMEHETD